MRSLFKKDRSATEQQPFAGSRKQPAATVLVVDDSPFFRKRIRQELEGSPEIEVAGEASNGREAVELASRIKPDLITMDVAMPEMDGIAAVRKIMGAQATNIVMFSALTSDGARATLDALDAGAVDFFPKQHSLDAKNDGFLRQRVIEIVRRRPVRRRFLLRARRGCERQSI